MLLRLAASAVLCAMAALASADDARFSGAWRLNHELSQNLAKKIAAAAGKEHMSGGPEWARGTETWLPWGGKFSEPERVGVREYLLQTVPAFDAVEIQQGADEVKTTHGEAGSRRFYLKRTSAGTSDMTGETVTRAATLEGQRLVLESKGKESKLVEVLTLEPSGDRLVYQIRLEQKTLKTPLEARLVYDRGP